MCARRADERALRPWASYHPLHWTVSNRAPLPASRSQLPQLWANPQVSLLALALWGQRGGTALCSPGLERDSVPPAAGGGRTPTRGTGISDKHELATLGHIYVARGWLRLHSGEPLEHSIAAEFRGRGPLFTPRALISETCRKRGSSTRSRRRLPHWRGNSHLVSQLADSFTSDASSSLYKLATKAQPAAAPAASMAHTTYTRFYCKV